MTPQPSPQQDTPSSSTPAGVGIVVPQTTPFDRPLPLRSGRTLIRFTLAYETYGTLSPARDNAILLCHALSGDAHVAGVYSSNPDETAGWWDDAVGPGRIFDTDRYFVICSNVLGGCRGSTGPASPHPDDGRPFGLRFPVMTIADMVAAQVRLIERLGIRRLFAVGGGSMGGMQALEWAVSYPERVANLLFIASTPQASAQQIAFNEIGRQAIYADPRWNHGDYYHNAEYPDAGLAVARMVGHITYMSESSLQEKFGRTYQHTSGPAYHFDTDFAVESYLRYQGHKFTKRFDANSYLYVTKALDYFDIAEEYGGSLDAALGRIEAGVLAMSFTSDWLYTAREAHLLVDALEKQQKPVEYHHVEASFGHDSFLVEVDTMTRIVGGYLDRAWQAEQQAQWQTADSG